MLPHTSGATAIKSSGHLSSSSLLYLLLLVDCSIALPQWAWAVFCQFIRPSLTMESMVPPKRIWAERFEESAHTLFVSLQLPGYCIDTAVLSPE
jgi:hypothetical protein